ncbi:MAG: S1/P1 nuclease [Kiritimatiellae bacterium]|nr:S1/P1 nuclease [Kiritimatiellia bacterium]
MGMNKSAIAWLALAAILIHLGAPSAKAWGPKGHRVVAHIAELRLSEDAHRALSQILEAHEQISDNYICNWPDYVRRDMPETGPWHFVDIPFEATSYDPKRDCPDGQCIIYQIDEMAKIVADTTKPLADRHVALRFLVHMLGDIHQPLHCIEYDLDRGGNERLVNFPGQSQPARLHAVWDSHLVTAAMGALGALEYADKLNEKISNRRARHWAKGTAEDWALDSHDIAHDHAYSVLPEKNGPPLDLDNEYVKANKKIVEVQLMKGGIRLATLLNRILEPIASANLQELIPAPSE